MCCQWKNVKRFENILISSLILFINCPFSSLLNFSTGIFNIEENTFFFKSISILVPIFNCNLFAIYVKKLCPNKININKKHLLDLKDNYVLKNPLAVYEIKEQKLDILIDNLNKSINKLLEDNKIKLYTYSNSYVLNNPEILYKYSSQKLEHIISKLEVLNPLNTLNRGYAIIKKDNKVLSSIKNINNDDIIKISLKDGEVSSKVIKGGE